MPSLSAAAEHYVRAGASGDGSSWDAALGDLPASLTRGDVYYVAAGSYAGHDFADPGDAPITVRAATAADHGAGAGWKDSYAGQAVFPGLGFAASHVVIDGATRASPTSGHGIKIDLGLSPDCKGICAGLFLSPEQAVSDITARYVEIVGYGTSSDHTQDGVYGNNYQDKGMSQVTLSYLYLHDFGAGGTPIQTGAWDGVVLEHSVVARNISTPTQHSEAWSDMGSGHVVVRYNWFEDIQGTGVLVSLNAGGSDQSNDWDVYGNVMYQKDSVKNGVGDGVIACINGNECSNWHIYDNTFVNFTNGSLSGRIAWFDAAASSKNVVVENNLWFNCDHVEGASPAVSYDYNAYFSSNNPNPDPHAEVAASDPFVSSSGADFHLAAETDDGHHLPSPYDVDPDGKLRGSDHGIWSRGAFQFGGTAAPGSGGSASKPAASDDGGGCGCRAAGEPARRGAALLLVAWVALFGALRRR